MLIENARMTTCPACGNRIEPLPVVFGLPAHETVEEAVAGKIRLGGWVVGPDDPTLACPLCEAWLGVTPDGSLYMHPWRWNRPISCRCGLARRAIAPAPRG